MTHSMVTGQSPCQTAAQTYSSQADRGVGVSRLGGQAGGRKLRGDSLHTNWMTGPRVGSVRCALASGTQGVAQKPFSSAVIPPKPVEFCCQTQKVSWTLFLRQDSATQVKQESRNVLLT